MNVFRNAINRSLRAYPVVTNSVIYGSLCTAAEFSQQFISKKVLAEYPKPLDSDTIARYTIYGIFVGGPLIAVWYRFLDKKMPGITKTVILRKLLVDQFFFTPQLLVAFYIAMGVMERKEDLFEEMRSKFLQTFKTSCLFWIPAQTINFMLIPCIYRVSYIGICSFAWINILCMIKRQSKTVVN